jgi:hypothetical protein
LIRRGGSFGKALSENDLLFLYWGTATAVEDGEKSVAKRIRLKTAWITGYRPALCYTPAKYKKEKTVFDPSRLSIGDCFDC